MKFIDKLKHAFAVSDSQPISDDERALLHRFARFVVKRQMGEAAIMLLESIKPLNFLGAQALHFLAPFATFVFNQTEYNRFAQLMERRESISLLVNLIETEMQKSKNGKEVAK